MKKLLLAGAACLMAGTPALANPQQQWNTHSSQGNMAALAANERQCLKDIENLDYMSNYAFGYRVRGNQVQSIVWGTSHKQNFKHIVCQYGEWVTLGQEYKSMWGSVPYHKVYNIENGVLSKYISRYQGGEWNIRKLSIGVKCSLVPMSALSEYERSSLPRHVLERRGMKSVMLPKWGSPGEWAVCRANGQRFRVADPSYFDYNATPKNMGWKVEHSSHTGKGANAVTTGAHSKWL